MVNSSIESRFRELIGNKRKFIETLLVVEDKSRKRVPFIYNPIQADADATETGRDIWLKPSQVGFSTERIAKRLVDTITVPGTNTVLIAYEDFITERLLSKVSFFFNHLASLGIPGFPEIHHDSTYEKTFRFIVNGITVSTSSIYIASARSFVAGRAQTIHHLLLDEFAFYPKDAMNNIVAPALARVPPDGTVDIYSTPNGEDNAFHDMYKLAVEGKSVFKPHFYPWWMHPEYKIELGDSRIKQFIPETGVETFKLTVEEETLQQRGLTYSQIRWRRWKIFEMESLRRKGEMATLFVQEFPEDDVSCFMATGDMYFDIHVVDSIANRTTPPLLERDNLSIWHPPEPDRRYIVSIDPGQAKVTQTAITVATFKVDDYGNYLPVYCARDAGLYPPELTAKKAVAASNYYNRSIITWEANSHGLAITELLKKRKPIYLRKDIVSGVVSMEPGWLTTSRTKDYLLQTVSKYLPDLECQDIEFVRQLRNHRLEGDKLVIIGPNDIFMSFAIGLVCLNPKPLKRGYMGRSGWKW